GRCEARIRSSCVRIGHKGICGSGANRICLREHVQRSVRAIKVATDDRQRAANSFHPEPAARLGRKAGFGRQTFASPFASTVILGQLRGKRSEEHTSELQSRGHLVCRLLLEKKKNQPIRAITTQDPSSPSC